MDADDTPLLGNSLSYDGSEESSNNDDSAKLKDMVLFHGKVRRSELCVCRCRVRLHISFVCWVFPLHAFVCLFPPYVCMCFHDI